MNLVRFPTAVLLAALAGCAAAPRMGSVIPKEGGLYQVVSTAETESAALKSALHTAELTCGERGMRHVVLDHKTEYRGLGAEGAAQAIEKLRRILLGGPGSGAPSLSSEEDYRTSMQFRCEG